MTLASDARAALVALDTDPLAAHRTELVGTCAPPARRFYAAAHVVMSDSYAGVAAEPAEVAAHVDWDGTFALRRYLDSQGLGVAEAMDTAQRFELGWDLARRLIEGTGALGLGHGFVAGAGADHLGPDADPEALVEGVVFQARVIQGAGGVPILLPLLNLPARGADAAAYFGHYRAVIDALEGPLLVHWLGEMFHPGLAGYFPGQSFARVMAHDPDKVRGCKLSLLDANFERRVRVELARRGQEVFTGDDLHFADLIVGQGAPEAPGDFSHALLGVFDGIAAPAGLALRALAAGDHGRARELLEPCEAFGRHVFSPPTRHYKAGLAFVNWMAGRQANPMLPCHLELARDRAHTLRTAELAALAGAFEDRGLARARLEAWLADPTW
jgi:Protein of unknown function (DUF993)